MKRVRIVHKTEYQYNQPVKFGPHRAMLRPREGHDVRIVRGSLDVTPAADIRWLRDIYGNSIAILTFAEPAEILRVLGEVDVDLRENEAIECLIDPSARDFPFQYAPEEQMELMQYRLPSYPYDGTRLQQWLLDVYRPGQIMGTFELLEKLNTHIFNAFSYAHRDAPGFSCPATRSRAAADRAAISRCS